MYYLRNAAEGSDHIAEYEIKHFWIQITQLNSRELQNQLIKFEKQNPNFTLDNRILHCRGV